MSNNGFSTMVGNLTADPELRVLNNGRAVWNGSVAVENSFLRGDKWENYTSFFNFTVWGDLADHCAESLHKGDRIFIAGRPEQGRWQTDDGDNRSSVKFIVEHIGPELRWAIIDGITRVKKSDSSSSVPDNESASDKVARLKAELKAANAAAKAGKDSGEKPF